MFSGPKPPARAAVTMTAALVLASQSPRRRDLLVRAGLTFTIDPSHIDEGKIPPSPPARYARDLALAKARDVTCRHPGSWVIGADTIVVKNDVILGKPASRDDAGRMLRMLSGGPHRVFTGFAICCKERGHHYTRTVKTEVVFKTLTEAEIGWYIRTGEPFDKAGGYGIQGFGARLVKRITGSYTNVVGLPVCEVVSHLIEAGVIRLD